MKYVLNDDVVLSRAPEGPLAAHLGAFAQAVSAQGYALTSIHRRVLLAACFSQWLQRKGVVLRHITSDHPRQYLRHRAGRYNPAWVMRLRSGTSWSFSAARA